MVEKIPELNCPYFFLQVTLSCPCLNEILELCLPCTKFVSYLYIVILSYMMKFIPDVEKSYI